MKHERSMLIRTVTGADAPEIAHVHIEAWRAAYRGQKTA